MVGRTLFNLFEYYNYDIWKTLVSHVDYVWFYFGCQLTLKFLYNNYCQCNVRRTKVELASVSLHVWHRVLMIGTGDHQPTIDFNIVATRRVMHSKTKSDIIQFRVSPYQREKLEALASLSGTTTSQVLRDLVMLAEPNDLPKFKMSHSQETH